MNLFALAGLSCSISCLVLSVIAFIFGKVKIHRVLTFFNVAVAIWSYGLFIVGIATNEKTALFGWKFAHIGGMFVSILFFHIVCLFCEIKRKPLLIFGYAQAIIFNWISWVPDRLITKTRYTYGLYYNDTTILFALAVLSYLTLVVASFYELVIFLKKTKGTKRLQAIYIILSFSIGFIGGTSTFLPEFRIDLFYPAGGFGVALYALIGTYAILRHRLLDIKVAATRTIVFGLVYLLVLGIPFWVGYKYNLWQYSTWAMLILATLGPFIFMRLLRRAEDIIFKERRTYQEVIANLSKSMIDIRDINQLFDTITSTTVGTVKITFAVVYLKAEEYKSFQLKSHYPKDVKGNYQEFVPENHFLINALLQQEKPLLSEELNYQDRIIPDMALVIPCFGKDGLLGLIILGAKQNNQMYTNDDILTFKTLSYATSLAIESCTYWKELEEKHRQARMAEMDLFSYSVAHEIDNPMSIIKGNAEYLRRLFFKGLNLTEEQQKDAEEVVTAILEAQIRVTGMVKAIEEFGKKTPAEMVPFKFSEVLEHYFNLYIPILKNHHIQLTKNVPSELPYVRGHLQELMQVLAIFSQNSMHALRYIPEKKVHLKVETVNSGWIKVLFSDTGYGIEKEKLSAIFSAFVTTKASSEGTGMGLYNAKRFILKHQGRIWAESEGKNKGATLIFEVPIAKDVTEQEIKKSQEDKGNRKF